MVRSTTSYATVVALFLRLEKMVSERSPIPYRKGLQEHSNATSIYSLDRCKCGNATHIIKYDDKNECLSENDSVGKGGYSVDLINSAPVFGH